jgi:hypothetical protein
MLPFAPAKPEPPAEYTTCATKAETKNMETPAGIRFTVSGVSSKVDCIVECIVDPMESVDMRTPVNGADAGKMSIPYERASRMLRRHPRRTAGRAARARDDVCLIEFGLRRVRVDATALETRVGFDLWGEEEEDVCARVKPDSGSPPTGPLCDRSGVLSLAPTSGLDSEDWNSCEGSLGKLVTGDDSTSDLSEMFESRCGGGDGRRSPPARVGRVETTGEDDAGEFDPPDADPPEPDPDPDA